MSDNETSGLLTDEQIAQKWRAACEPERPTVDLVAGFARAIESATRAPLLAEVARLTAALEAANNAAIAAQAQGEPPPVLVRDLAQLIGSDVPTVCMAFDALGLAPRSTNMAVGGEEAVAVATHLKAAQAQGEPVRWADATQVWWIESLDGAVRLTLGHGFAPDDGLPMNCALAMPLAELVMSLRAKSKSLEGVTFEDNDGASRKSPKDCQCFDADGVPAAVWVNGKRYTQERPKSQEQCPICHAHGGHFIGCAVLQIRTEASPPAAQPVRQPLTDEQRIRMFIDLNSQCAQADSPSAMFTVIVQAVERAHGITGEKA